MALSIALLVWNCGVDSAEEHDHPHEREPDCSTGECGSYENGKADNFGVAVASVSGCSTIAVRGLTEQIASEMECIRPNTFARIDNIRGVDLLPSVVPFLQPAAKNALARVAAQGGRIEVNSAWRSLPQQFLLHRWFQQGRCGISAAAPPGASNHETGVAVDIENWSSLRNTMERNGFRWLGSFDRWHYDYVGAGTIDLGGLSIRAFQRLWNLNHPNDRIAVDGSYGPTTASRLARAPSSGFSIGSSCQTFEPEPPVLAPLEVYWVRLQDGTYKLHALASPDVVAIQYRVDGFDIGRSTRADGHNFPAFYEFSRNGQQRLFEAIGLSSSGEPIARGIGWIDVTSEMAVFVKQMGLNTFEVGLERAPNSVASVQVTVDGTWVLTDSVSGQSHSTRKAVRHTFNQLGVRTFEIKMFAANGSNLGTVTRRLDLTPAQ